MRVKLLCIVLVSWVGLFSSCDRPKEIPDEQFVAIVKEIILANAYWGSGKMDYKMMQDSVDVYTPILDRYGYRPKDFIYTVQELSERKSIRFADIIDAAATRIETEGQVYFDRIKMSDTIEQIALERFKKSVMKEDSLRLYKKLSDEEKPDMKIPITQSGKLIITFKAELDSASRYLQCQYFVIDSMDRKINRGSRGYRKGVNMNEKIELLVDHPRMKEIALLFASSRSEEKAKPLVRVDSLEVIFYPTVDAALDSLIQELLFQPQPPLPTLQNISLENSSDAQNFVTLRMDTAGVTVRRDSLVRSDRTPR